MQNQDLSVQQFMSLMGDMNFHVKQALHHDRMVEHHAGDAKRAGESFYQKRSEIFDFVGRFLKPGEFLVIPEWGTVIGCNGIMDRVVLGKMVDLTELYKRVERRNLKVTVGPADSLASEVVGGDKPENWAEPGTVEHAEFGRKVDADA